jgi:vacuolar protein sorting-associated protein 13A/C
MEKLQNAELLQERTSDGMSQEEQQKNQSFAASLTTKVTKAQCRGPDGRTLT